MKTFDIGDSKRKYEKMKAQGKCPYDSYREYLDSLVNSFITKEDIERGANNEVNNCRKTERCR